MSNRGYIRLVERAQEGDLAAFSELVVRFQDLAVGSAFGWLSEIETARDVTQEAFLEAFLHLGQLREPAAFPAWFRKIVRKHCDRVTRRKRYLTSPIELANDVPDIQAGPEEELVTGEQTQHLRLAVESLPAEQRLVVALHYFAEASGRELAEFLELPLSTIKKRLRDARRLLRDEGDKLMRESIRRMRPSNTSDFAQEVAFFVALRKGDRNAVAQLLKATPGLVNAQQNWDPQLVFDGVLPFASKATALITAIERGDFAMQTLLLDAGADVAGSCGCATGESPLWTATLFNRGAHVADLLARRADPDARSASGNRPLHLAAMRGLTEIASMLLEYGADPQAKDAGAKFPAQFSPADGRADELPAPRTPAQWARAKGHVALAKMIEGARVNTRSVDHHADSRASAISPNSDVIHTGIKALDLFAPIPRGGLVRLPFKAGVGMVVLLGELCQRFIAMKDGAAIWTGFTQPPFDLRDWEAEMSEFGLKGSVHHSLVGFEESPEIRRAAYQRGLQLAETLRDSGRDVLAVVLSSEGYINDIDASLLRLAAHKNSGSITTIVVTPFPEQRKVFAELQVPYSAQITLDRVRASRHLFPAIDPRYSMSTALTDEIVGERHVLLAAGARRLFDEYRQIDSELALLHSQGSAKDTSAIRRAHKLFRFLCQPFCITEPFTGRMGEQVALADLLNEVETIINS